MKWLLLGVLVLLVGCIEDPTDIESEDDFDFMADNGGELDVDEEAFEDEVELSVDEGDKVIDTEDPAEQRRRRLEATTLFDFSQIDYYDCDELERDYEFKLEKATEDLDDTREEFDEQEEDYLQALNEFQNLPNDAESNERDRVDRKLDRAEESFDVVDDRLEEEEEYVGKLINTLKEIRKECKRRAAEANK